MQLNKIRGHQTDQLFKAMLELKTIEECYEFFDDLCTISEMQSLCSETRRRTNAKYEKDVRYDSK